SSRRRHTRSKRDWSSDVCSSDLALMAKSEEIQQSDLPLELTAAKEWLAALDRLLPAKSPLDATLTAIERHLVHRALAQSNGVQRSEERRVGKEWRSGWWRWD